ncbi:hypothetical protein CRM22_009989 [Opisthorchis felineus]|uniref:Uncharacterized protein n=1 Tax=Opisthorchis felineus TaxID=147828 RepID=A0A4S2L9I5_OPIFE|nr:hypothetical protein CRM22_009989 [Opisthorchis felineus]
MENSGGVASYGEFNGNLGGYHKTGPLAYHSDAADISKGLPSDGGSEEFFSNSSHSCMSAAFDEDFPVNGDEEVQTPCVSPTLDALRNISTVVKLSPRPLSSNPILDLPKSDHFNFVAKSLSDAVLRPCQYTLDKRYDESIPVRTLRRSMRENSKLNGDKCALLDKKMTLGPRPFTQIRRLENIVPCPISPLPRITSYSSSSGSLIGHINGLSFEPNGFIMSDSLSFANGIRDRPSDMLKACRSADLSHTLKNGFDDFPSEITVANAPSSMHIGGDADDTEKAPKSAPAFLCSSQPTCSKDLEVRSGTSDTGESNVSGADGLRKRKHSKRSRRNRSTIKQTTAQSVRVKCEPPQSVLDSTKEHENQMMKENEGIQEEPTLNESNDADVNNEATLINRATDISQRSTTTEPPETTQEMLSIDQLPVEDSVAADGDFTLVTNKKHKRQQKLQQQLQQQQQQQVQAWIPSARTPPISTSFRPQKLTTANVRLPVPPNQSLSANKVSTSPSFRPTNLPPGDRRRFGNFNRPNAPLLNQVRRPTPNSGPHRPSMHSSDTSVPLIKTTVSSQPPLDCKVPQPLTKAQTSFPTEKHTVAQPSCTEVPRVATHPSVSHSTLFKSDFNNQPLIGIRPVHYQLLLDFLLSSWSAFRRKSTGSQKLPDI